jgi:hypothetical protein
VTGGPAGEQSGAAAGGRRAQAGGRWGERRRWIWERRERTEKKKGPTVFKNLIFGGSALAAENSSQFSAAVSGPPKIRLFSVAVSVAAENRLIFCGCVRPLRII